jgi:Tfp pilus assembly protein PilF
MRAPLFVLLLVSLAAVEPAHSQVASKAEQVSLSKELEGLEPGPRIAYLNHLLETRSDDPEVYFQLGVAFQDDEKPDSALVYYRKAVEHSPQMSKAYVNMGVLLDSQNRPREALQMFETAAKMNPRDVLAHAHAAAIMLDESDYENAWAHLEKALAIDSLNPQPHFYLAIFFWESGMLRESLVEWETVVSLAPGSYLAQKAEENITLIQRALTSAPGENSPMPKR